MAQYEAVGATLEDAIRKAHDQIPPRQGRDFAASKVVTWGMQTGGFMNTRIFYAIVEEDPNAPFRSEQAPATN